MARKGRRMTVTRRKSILDEAQRKGEVLITELSKQFRVSEVTIRNDLSYLERKGLVMRARGGAMKVDNMVGTDPTILDKSKVRVVEKMAIAKCSAQIIREDETIILDGGTTTAEIAKNLDGFKHLTVITNALNIVNILVGKHNIELIVPGGYLRQNSMSLIGSMAEKSLSNFYVDKAFISTDGFDTRQGIFTPNIEEASLNKVMISISKEIILVTDSTKFSKKSLVFICGLDKIDKVITDKGISADDQKRLNDEGIEIVLAR